MNYRSTSGGVAGRRFDEVVIEGAAPDGGLYVPDSLPEYRFPDPGSAHPAFVARSLQAFGATEVDDLAADAFRRFHHADVAPLREVGGFLLMELFWGPTLSFKDHALTILGRLFDRYLSERGESRTVLVATSGDTGSAAIEGFRGLDSVRIVVLYPKGMVSDYQRRQMTTVADPNVTVLAVEGTFDDCQRLVKEAFRSRPGLASANSINWGRIAAQVGYYMSAASRIGGEFDVVVPTGNFGNAYSAWLARRMGAQIRRVAIATNANRVLFDLQVGGAVRAGTPVRTLAPAMDIQVPSNLERFLADHTAADFAAEFEAGWADDETIIETIRRVHDEHDVVIDPHTATAWSVAESLGVGDGRPVVVVATAHPAKFAGTIEQALGFSPAIPAWGVIDPDSPETAITIDAEPAALYPHL